MTEYNYEIIPLIKNSTTEADGWVLNLIENNKQTFGGVFKTRGEATIKAMDWLQAHKLTSSQAHKLTSSQAHKLTSSQAHKLISLTINPLFKQAFFL